MTGTVMSRPVLASIIGVEVGVSGATTVASRRSGGRVGAASRAIARLTSASGRP